MMANYAQLQKDILAACAPFDVLALTLEHSAELDASMAVTALDSIARHPRRKEVERDMRLSKLVFDINYMLHGHRTFRPRELSRCAMAYASLGIKQPTIMYCIAVETLKKVYDFKASEWVTLLFGFALAGILDCAMMEAAAKELIRKVGECTPREVGELAWALAILRCRSDMLMLAISDITYERMKDFTSLSLARVVWSLDVFGHRTLSSDLLRRAVQVFKEAHSREDMQELLAVACILGHAPDPWQVALDHSFLRPIVGTLVRIAEGDAISASELYDLSAQAPHLGKDHTRRALQPIGLQVSVGGEKAAPWVAEARELLRSIFDERGPIETFPMVDRQERVTLPIVDKETYSRNMADFGVDNFGKIGGRCLLNQIGIGKCNETWVANAKQYVAAWADGVGKRSDDWKAHTVHRRIYVFGEYHFASTLWPMTPLLEGTSFQLNGLRSDPETARRPYLCAVPLPISKWVDRTLCAEFQLLSEVCDMLNRAGIEMTSPELRHSVYGLLSLYLSEPSCVSCVGSFKQFQTLFPGVDVLVDCSSVVEPLMARTEMDLEARQLEEEEERERLERAEAAKWAEEHPDWKEGDDWKEEDSAAT